MVKITQDFIPAGSKNRPGYSNPKNYVTIHNTGNTSVGAGAKNHANYVKNGGVTALVSWHYTVDDIEIYQHLPEDETGYHAGDGSGKGNRQSIGIEICMNSDGDLLKATDNAVELVADICRRNNIPIANIKQHYDWSGKDCPQMIRSGKPYDWNTFISKVNNLMVDVPNDESEIVDKTENTTEWYRVRAGWQNADTQQGAFHDIEYAKALADKLNNATTFYVYDDNGNVIYPK